VVDNLLNRGAGAVGAMFERVMGAGFDAPDPLVAPSFGPPAQVNPSFGPGVQLSGNPFGDAQVQVNPDFGPGVQVSANPFDRGGVQLESDPFGTGGGVGIGQVSFGDPVQISGNPFSPPYYPPPVTSPTGTQPGGPTGSASGWAGPATSDDNKTLTAQQIDAWIARTRPNAPINGMGAFILATANQYGVSAPQMLAQFLKESELGTTAGPNKILSGITDPGKDQGLGNARAFEGFATWQDAITAHARLLSTSDYYRGKSLQEQIGNWYVGPEEYKRNGLAATDKAGNGTVADYLNLVSSVYAALGVPLNATTAPTRTGGGSPIANPSALEQAAQPLIGNPYQLGGRRANGKVGPGIGIDCSEFTAYLYEQQGITLTWNAYAQYNQTQRVERGQWQPGDLIFFQGTSNTDGSPVSHVGMFVGYDAQGRPMMLHSGSNGVEYANLNEAYYQNHYFGAGRVTR